MFYSYVVYAFLSLAVYPFLILVLLLALLLMYLVTKFALRTSVDALRFDAISRSPINSYFSASL